MFFSRPNELHPSGSGKTGRVIAKHVPVRSISISLIYFSEPTRYTRTSAGRCRWRTATREREIVPCALPLPTTCSRGQRWDTRARLGVPQRGERGRGREKEGRRKRGRVYTGWIVVCPQITCEVRLYPIEGRYMYRVWINYISFLKNEQEISSSLISAIHPQNTLLPY